MEIRAMQQPVRALCHPVACSTLSGQKRQQGDVLRAVVPASASRGDVVAHSFPSATLATNSPPQVLSGHPDAVRRRQEAVKRMKDSRHQIELAQQARWYEGPLPSNFLRVASPDAFLEAISGDKLVIADYFVPWCLACRRFHPALIKLASNNPECTFLAVNGGDHALHEFVASLGVEKLPYFQFYRCGEVLSQFAANLSKIRQLRSEIERLKKKTLDACILDSQRQIVQKLARE